MGINRLSWASSGHEREYTLNFEVYGHENYIPRSIERKLEEALPGFYVCNRGSRIEIMVPDESYEDRSRSILHEEVHAKVHGVVLELFRDEYGDIPLTINEIEPYVPPLKTCRIEGCRHVGTMKEIISHMRAEHPRN